MRRFNRKEIAVPAVLAAALLWAPGSGLLAQNISPHNLRQLHDQIELLRQEQERQIAQIRQRTDQQVDAIQAELARYAASPSADVATAGPTLKQVASIAEPLQVAGDLRLRYERDFGATGLPNRNRGRLRARLGSSYQLTNWLGVGARLVTGDPDDPNSADATLSDFVDDLSVSLDQAYAKMHFGAADVYAGKVPNPFTRTELVFDADVNPEGLSGSWNVALAGHAVVRVAAGYFVVEEQATGPDSALRALQLALSMQSSPRWRHELALAYYDYDLVGLSGADNGDTRTNLLTPGAQSYRSDFDLVDFVASTTFDAAGRPIRVVGNYVRNLGAATSADMGYGLDLMLGRMGKSGDSRISVGYAVAQTDAVLAAFSQDNTTLGSNYRQYTLSLDYAIAPRVILNTTWYYYRLNDIADAAAGASDAWTNRVQLNLLLQF